MNNAPSGHARTRAKREASLKSKFKVGQVVMVNDGSNGKYPVKLKKETGIGTLGRGRAWMDTLNHVEYESQMRPLTKSEAGGLKK